MSPISFDQFLAAMAPYGEANNVMPVATTKLWSDFGICGFDALDFFVCLEDALSCSISTDIDIYTYIPDDDEIGWFGRLKTKRLISDITLAELFAHLEFAPRDNL